MSQAPTVALMLTELRQLVQRAQHLRWRERYSRRRRPYFAVARSEEDVREFCKFLRALIYRAHSAKQAQLSAMKTTGV